MEFDLISNPLLLIFKLTPAGAISEEIEDPSKFPSLYNYMLENSNKKNKIQIINIINILKEIIKRQRSVCAYFPKYNNKSLYIFLMELFLKENNTPQLRTALIELISELCANIQISKEVYEFIFQKFSKLYRKEQNFLNNIKDMNYSINDYFSSLLELLNTTFSKIDKERILPSNYFSCFGNNSFNLNFNKNLLNFGNYFSFILNFKISKSKLMEKNSQIFNKCRLITINFTDNKKELRIELKYPNNLYLIDGKEEIKTNTVPLGDWVSLLVTLSETKGNISAYFSINGENMKDPLKMKSIKLSKDDKINFISFFDNFYGEVTSQKNNDSFNTFSKNLKIFSEMKRGLWDKKHISNFIKYSQNLIYSDKKRDKGGGNLYNDLIGIFTPINYDSTQPKFIEDCLGNYIMEINGNIRNHKFHPYQKYIYQICSVNNFLPIAEMFIIHQKELLNEKNFIDYLQLISKIACGKDNLIAMNKSHFFKLLGMILEKLPNEFFNENILKEFESIGNNILGQNIKDFYSDFFIEILLNEKIILKYNDDLRSSFWNIFLQLYLTNKENMRFYLDTDKLCNILLIYDEMSHKKMCCEFHLNMFKKEFIGNMELMQPNLTYQLISLKKLIVEHLMTQNMDSFASLIELLIFDISPCMAKFILEILINIFTTSHKNEQWIKNITLEIFKTQFITIFINLFIHSLPDIRYEILTLMFHLYISLLKHKCVDKFTIFEKMLKTCLLPGNIFYSEKSTNIKQKTKTNKSDDNEDIDKNLNMKKVNIKPKENNMSIKKEEIINNKNKEKMNNDNEKEKSKNNSEKEKGKTKNKIDDTNIKPKDEQKAKRNSIFSLAEKFENKNKNNDKKIVTNKNTNITSKMNPTKLSEGKVDNNDNQQNQTKSENINILKDNEEIKVKSEKEELKKDDIIKEDNKRSNDDYIIKSGIFNIYIDNIYNLLLQWALGIQTTYNPSSSNELFSPSQQKKKNDILKNNLIMNMNILEILFFLNKNVDDINFTSHFIDDFEKLMDLSENSYFVMLNDKIYSSLLDITFKFYNKGEANSKENEIYRKGIKLCVHIFMNNLKYLQNQHTELPMKKLEIFLIWGNISLNYSNHEDIVFNFIHDLFSELLNKFKELFKDKLIYIFQFNFEKESQVINNFYFKNYLALLSFIYNFSIHYKLDRVLKKTDIDIFISSDLKITIPDIFISGIRTNFLKRNTFSSINEYWKDFHLMEIILNEFEYIFKYSYIKNKIYKQDNSLQKKKKEKTKNLKYDKYNKILNDLIFDTGKRNLFSKELYILCFHELNDKNTSLIIPFIKMVSIIYTCILSLFKNIENKSQFISWLDKYKNFLRFLLLTSINLNRNKNESDAFNVIQNSCFEVISSGLCFLNNLLEVYSSFKEEIKRVINNLFLLCFSILKIYLNKKLFVNNPEIYSYPNAILILFNDYVKDQNKMPLINLTKLDKIYLNKDNNICDLIQNKEFVDSFFQNKNLKNKLYEDYYSITTYKNIINERYKSVINLEDKLDYSYQVGIYDAFLEFEMDVIKLNNDRYKNKIKKRKEYKRQKQKIFCFNGMWSNRELFYGSINFGKIKYKVMNHYSKDLMRPLIRPIFDINYYLPEFPNFKKENLFLENNSKEVFTNISYDLILDFEHILKISNINKEKTKTLILDKNNTSELILREKFYKSDLKYYVFLEKISKILEAQLKEEEIQDDFVEIKSSKEELTKINTNVFNERKTTTITASTRISTIKEPKKHRGSFQTSFINLSFDKEKGVVKDEEEIYTDGEYIKCCLVKSTHHIKGLFYIKDKKITFKNLLGQKMENDFEIELNEKDDNYDIERGDCFGSYFKKYYKDKNFYKLSINFSDIKTILKRKYYYKNSSFEIFTRKNKSYFFNFNNENIRKNILDEIIQKISDYSTIINDIKDFKESINKDNIIGYFNNKYLNTNKLESKKNMIKLSRLVKTWKNWEISNFEFLMLLNMLSNRSYIDISQYPVFPWLLINYEDPLIKETLDKKDYSYRNLSLPMGMLNINEDSSRRSLNYTSTFKIIKGDKNINKPYYYGCNYSNPTYICNYLIRLFPFTQACIEIQGTGFDTPHRLFTSVMKAFKNASTQSTDVRELIPEFFYLPEMFLNLNSLNLGKLNDNIQVGDVVTPCGNNPYEFTMIMKNLLESQSVSSSLNNWIDLIFGIKAKDKEAEDARNLFTEQAYQEDINIEEIEDKASFMRYIEFGLIPNQLFNVKEAEKKEKLDDMKKIKQITDSNYNLKYNKNKKVSSGYSSQFNDLVLLGIKNIANDRFIFVYNNSLIVEKKIWCSNKECGEDIISKKQISNINKICYNFEHFLQFNKNVKIIKEGKIIIMGGFYDGKLSIIENDSGNNNLSLNPFKDESIITTINTDFEEKYLFIGNNIGNISIMSIESTNIYEWESIYFLNDQLNEISSIETNYQLNVWSSASIDGFINLYTLPSCKLIHSFKLDTNNSCNNIFICDSPLPSILVICQDEVYLYSINGHKIYYQKEYSKIINPILIKDFIKNDYLVYITNGKEISIRDISDFNLISNIEIEREICYLFPNDNNKILYAINKNGVEMNAIFCENKKITKEK